VPRQFGTRRKLTVSAEAGSVALAAYDKAPGYSGKSWPAGGGGAKIGLGRVFSVVSKVSKKPHRAPQVHQLASPRGETHYRVMSGLERTPLSSLLDFAWRTAFRLGFPLARIWWRLTRPRHEGVVVAVYVGPALLH
jgi:hypothetical protein